MPNMLVSGAGTSLVNGTYVEIGTLNGKPQYQYSTNRYLQWTGALWAIILAGNRYYSNDDVATPDLCTTWVQGSGAPPVPTVTSSGGGEPEPETSIIPLAMMHYARMRNS